jgi:thymidylate synthase (FAD)
VPKSTSYGRGTTQVNRDEGLIRYLMRKRHTSPFERGDMVFHIKMPIFVARQWIRHRTASLNEYSARYSVLSNEFYSPKLEYISEQSKTNNQGREGSFSLAKAEIVKKAIDDANSASYNMYEILLDTNLSREIARGVIPSNVYTEMYWKCNLHNIFHFLKLRMDSHAQREIRDYANAMGSIVQDAFPMAWAAFDDYVVNVVSFSKKEQDLLRALRRNLVQ